MNFLRMHLQHVTLFLIVLLSNFMNSLKGAFDRGKYKSTMFKFSHTAETYFTV
jgi:hypothetical protein